MMVCWSYASFTFVSMWSLVGVVGNGVWNGCLVVHCSIPVMIAIIIGRLTFDFWRNVRRIFCRDCCFVLLVVSVHWKI